MEQREHEVRMSQSISTDTCLTFNVIYY